jgi:magnesium chelatase family protein
MSVTVWSGALQGVDAEPIQVEVDLLRRLPRFVIVGLAANAVKESGERVRSAIGGAGIEFPRQRVVVNLAPADLRKDGTALDLPVALGILAANGDVPAESLKDVLAVGELALSGELRPIRGALSLATLARSLERTLLLPRATAWQAQLVPGARVVGVDSLAEAVAWLRGESSPAAAAPVPQPTRSCGPDLADVRGQHVARRALEIAAAGAHHLLLVGPPGCGKSMLAQRLPTILPDPTFEEALDVSRIHSAAGLLDATGGLVSRRPFRAPHHTVSVAGMVGDRSLRPGEVSLAHHGVLFLDEAAEFPRHVLEVLRQPLEDGAVRLSRAAGTVEYPACLTLVLATNPCPCGHRGSNRPCACTDGDVHRYLRRLSGPVLDRVDLRVALQPLTSRELVAGPPGESSADVRDRVVAARARQSARQQGRPNAQLDAAGVRAHAPLDDAARRLLEDGADRFQLSGRATTRLLKVARTVADLAGQERVAEEHVGEALALRVAEAA